MTQPLEQQLTNEDYQFINDNELGLPIAVYYLKPIYFYIFRTCCVCLLVLGFIILALDLYIGPRDDYEFFAMYIGLSIVSLLAGLYLLRVELPKVQKQHVIVCEHGLLEIKGISHGKRMKVIHIYWQDIFTVRRLYNGYAVRLRGYKSLTLEISYRNVKELVAHIKQRSQENDNYAGPLEGYRLNREQLLLRAIEPIKGGTFFRIVFYVGIGLVALFGFIWVITGRTLFAWLMYGAMALIPVVIVPVSYWRIKKIVTHIKANTPEE